MKPAISLAAGAIVLAAIFTPGAAGAAEVRLMLAVTVNGHPTGMIGEFTERDGLIFTDPDELEALGFRATEFTARAPGGLVVLSEVAGFDADLDQATQTLHVTAGDHLLLPHRLEMGPPPAALLPLESGTGATVNYGVFGIFGSDGFVGGGLFDLRGFSPWGQLSSELLVNGGGGEPARAVRLDTAYTWAEPDSLARVRVGDLITGGLAWSRSVRLGGVQGGIDFALRPDLVTLPLPVVTGTAAVPSTVDVLVNDVRVFSGEVAAGPFEIPSLPVISGASDVTLTLTDASGRQVVTTAPFYTSGGMLAAGLQAFSLEAGVIRRDFGFTSNDYDTMAGSGTWRRGLTDHVTAQAHAEATGELLMAGGGATANIGEFGVVALDGAASVTKGGVRGLVSVGIERTGNPVSLAASATLAQSGFADIASVDTAYPTLRLNAGLGLGLGRYGTIGVSYTLLRTPGATSAAASAGAPDAGGIVLIEPAQEVQIVSVSYSAQYNSLSLFASGFGDLENGSTGIFAGISLPFGRRGAADLGGGVVVGSPHGRLGLNRAATEIGEVGYQLSVAHEREPHAFGQVRYVSPWATVTGGLDVRDDDLTIRADATGAISVLGGDVFVTNQIFDAFAVVDTAGVEGVRVMRENRLVGTTGAGGRIFVHDLRAFDVNHLSIEPTDVPIDASISFVERDVRPRERSGVVVEFPIRQSHGALLRLVDESGAPIPVGSTVTLLGNDEIAPVGYDGEVYLQDLQAVNEIRVEMPRGARCGLTVEYRPQPGGIPTIGPLTCRSGA